MPKKKSQWHAIKQLFSEWSQDNVPRLGAALAYYAAFSIAPLIIIVLAAAGLIFGREAAAGVLNDQLRELLGEQGAQGVAGLVASADKPTVGLVATIGAIIVLVFGASGVFGELQSSLNAIGTLSSLHKVFGEPLKIDFCPLQWCWGPVFYCWFLWSSVPFWRRYQSGFQLQSLYPLG